MSEKRAASSFVDLKLQNEKISSNFADADHDWRSGHHWSGPGVGLRIVGLGFAVCGRGCKVWGVEFRVWNVGKDLVVGSER